MSFYKGNRMQSNTTKSELELQQISETHLSDEFHLLELVSK